MIDASNLMCYARQFVALPSVTDKLPNFTHTEFSRYHVYTHPWLDVENCKTNNIEILLLGYILNPHKPEQTNLDVILEIVNSISTINDVPKAIYHLSGRFVLILVIDNKEYVFHDPCGLRAFTYTKHNGENYFASDEKILSNFITLNKGKKYNKYQTSQLKNQFENFLPAGVSLYDNVYKLKANHYLDVSSYKQIRFYPSDKLIETSDLNGIVENSLSIFRGEFSALLKREKLAVTVTAGRDSRLLMALAEDQKQGDIHYYTMSYYSVLGKHYDIETPRKILKTKKLTHHVYDCRSEASNDFAAIYKSNSLMAHSEWCNIAYGMNKYYPQGRVNIKGVASEIVRCYTYSNKREYTNLYPLDISSLMNYGEKEYFLELDFIKQAVQEWFDDVKQIACEFSYNIFDLYLWEQRIGSWQTQSQLEWDIVQESYTPFNNRELINIMLSLSKSYRLFKNHKLYNAIIKRTWPQLNRYVYNNEKKGFAKLLAYIKNKISK